MSHNEAFASGGRKSKPAAGRTWTRSSRRFASLVLISATIAVSVSIDTKGEPGHPMVLAELKNSAGFREFIEQEIAKYSGDQKPKRSCVR